MRFGRDNENLGGVQVRRHPYFLYVSYLGTNTNGNIGQANWYRSTLRRKVGKWKFECQEELQCILWESRIMVILIKTCNSSLLASRHLTAKKQSIMLMCPLELVMYTPSPHQTIEDISTEVSMTQIYLNTTTKHWHSSFELFLYTCLFSSVEFIPTRNKRKMWHNQLKVVIQCIREPVK